MATAQIATESIDLRGHRGVHPRVGALDVLPFVPLLGLTIEDARASARRVGARIGREVGVPVYFYAEAAEPRGRSLSELRRGGFEALVRGFPEDRYPDILPEGWVEPGAHPTAGITCVGARSLLLAWNVVVEGVPMEEARRIAGELRETGGGFRGLRALAFLLPSKGQLQLSMNLEDAWNRRPFSVFREIERRVRSAGGSVVGTEVVGMLPGGLVFDAGADRLSPRAPRPLKGSDPPSPPARARTALRRGRGADLGPRASGGPVASRHPRGGCASRVRSRRARAMDRGAIGVEARSGGRCRHELRGTLPVPPRVQRVARSRAQGGDSVQPTAPPASALPDRTSAGCSRAAKAAEVI